MYAHSRDGRPESEWEDLGTHLRNVGGRAALLAAPFGAEILANVIGVLHDVGKADPAFLERLRGAEIRVDHSTAGAVLAVERYGPAVGKMLAFCIAGHHAGLANGSRKGGGTTPLNDRLRDFPLPSIPPGLADTPDSAAIMGRAFAPNSLRVPGCTDKFAIPFLIRMLFSALVDADFLETEKFYAGGRDREPCPVALPELRDRLHRHLRDKMERAEPTPVNRLRAAVLEDCIAAAQLPPGIFTLTAPTGVGKTLSSMAFALDHAEKHGLRRIINLIPYTSIIEQTGNVLREAMGNDGAILEHHSAFDFTAAGTDDDGGLRKLRRASENWDRPVIATTTVQLFESFYANRPSRCRKLHAVANSVIIVDEAQTLPLNLLRPCMEVLRELVRGYGCTVVLCTATQPALRREDGFDRGFAGTTEIVSDPAGLYRAMRRARYEVVPGVLTDEALVGRLVAEHQAMTIVNNRRHARDLYELVADQPGARHLSTWMCAAHRRAVLAEIRANLDAGRPVKLISTSLVEAGVDIDFPTVYRAVAGIDSIAQAGGRCNREGRLPGMGTVYIFDPGEVEGRRPPPELRQFASAAAAVLRKHGHDPVSLDAVRAYFGMVYWMRRSGDLDSVKVGEDGKPGILAALAEYAPTLDYPFADIARAFRFISDTTVPLIVPYGQVYDVLAELEAAETVGGIARKLQQYTVQVTPKDRDALVANGHAKVVRPDDFSDQFVVLMDRATYRDDVGLVL